MRKDSIDQKAIEAAYLIYSEKGGFDIQDYSHKPTDYYRGTVMEPETSSIVDAKFDELLPADVIDGGRYNRMKEDAESLNLQIDSLQDQMRISRQMGSFQALQDQMRKMKALIKEKEALDARMAVDNLGRKQMDDYNRTYDQEDSYSEKIQSVGERIAALEAMIADYTETNNEEEMF